MWKSTQFSSPFLVTDGHYAIPFQIFLPISTQILYSLLSGTIFQHTTEVNLIFFPLASPQDIALDLVKFSSPSHPHPTSQPLHFIFPIISILLKYFPSSQSPGRHCVSPYQIFQHLKYIPIPSHPTSQTLHFTLPIFASHSRVPHGADVHDALPVPKFKFPHGT